MTDVEGQDTADETTSSSAQSVASGGADEQGGGPHVSQQEVAEALLPFLMQALQQEAITTSSTAQQQPSVTPRQRLLFGPVPKARYVSVEHMPTAWWRSVAAEALASFFFIFFGVGNATLQGPTRVVSIAIGFALVLTILLGSYLGHGDVHVNPVVTLCMMLLGKIGVLRGAFYIVAQFGATLLAVFVLRAVLPEQGGRLASTMLQLAPGAGLAVEILCTAFLLFTIFAMAGGDPHDRLTPGPDTVGMRTLWAGLVIPFTVELCHLFAIPLTGCSLNPARSLATAAVATLNGYGHEVWAHHWVYWVGPIVGGLLGSALHYVLFARVVDSEHPPRRYFDKTFWSCT